MDISDGADRPWDHPWTTEEMRKRRREWSLAGDAGLLKHLQQFSETLVSKANKTQNALHSLATQLNETAILIDNVTNTSLALANTQFIESRVQEDDIEVQKKMADSVQESKDQNLSTADLIANVTDSVQKGLSIMDEKYRRMEVVDSDSDEEDDAIVLSVILGPNDPYQDRPLPYVIGCDKWKLSNKIGLESSSSESEQLEEEEEEESESDKNDMANHSIYHTNVDTKINVGRLSSSSSESDNYSDQRNDVAYINNGKLDGISQNNTDFISESATPVDHVAKVSAINDAVPNFAEELAKRLGTVRQGQKPVSTDQKQEISVNRQKDDIFVQKEEADMFSKESENIFNANKGLFDDHLSTDLWKEKPIKSFKSNIIPPSIDIPPPISSISTKPKSAIDDLFADADSEGSDDIFSSKNSGIKVRNDTVKGNAANAENIHKKYLDIATGGNIATSTPETNEYVSSIFSDEEEDRDLFSTSEKQLYKPVDLSPPSKKVVRGVSILGNVQASDGENNMSSRILRRPSSSTSGSETPTNYENVAGNVSENLASTIENTNSSGISIQPPSINNTGGSSIG
ncbi:hypothetical protein KM043_013015 [Ampulex compressa]|nr:hypothetical protein KM043_013015 [Ampulex compressa]